MVTGALGDRWRIRIGVAIRKARSSLMSRTSMASCCASAGTIATCFSPVRQPGQAQLEAFVIQLREGAFAYAFNRAF